MGTGASWPSSRASLVSSERGLMGGGERFAGWLVGLIDGAWLFFFLSFFLFLLLCFKMMPLPFCVVLFLSFWCAASVCPPPTNFSSPRSRAAQSCGTHSGGCGGGLLGRGSTLLFLFVCSCLCGWFCFGFACNAHRA